MILRTRETGNMLRYCIALECQWNNQEGSTWLPKHDLNMNGFNRHVSVKAEQLMRPQPMGTMGKG